MAQRNFRIEQWIDGHQSDDDIFIPGGWRLISETFTQAEALEEQLFGEYEMARPTRMRQCADIIPTYTPDRTKQRISFNFHVDEFKRSHGHAPRGAGSWAFEYQGKGLGAHNMRSLPIFAHGMSSYSNAKEWIKTYIRAGAPAEYVGVVHVYVCP